MQIGEQVLVRETYGQNEFLVIVTEIHIEHNYFCGYYQCVNRGKPLNALSKITSIFSIKDIVNTNMDLGI